MKFSYNTLQELTTNKLPEPQKLAELLTMHSFEVEELEAKGKDHILDIDILPNRAHDAASHMGIAREAAALSGGKLKAEEGSNFKVNKNKVGGIDIEIDNTYECKRYMAAIIEGVEVSESPAWLKEWLENLGLNSINNIVDAANYAMLVTGQPLHAFDLDKLSGNKIIVRNAKQGEAITTLDDDALILDSSMLVIADKEDALAVAGIKGGRKAEVDKNTKNILIESAWFNPMNIRTTSRHLGLRTDASWRFEHEAPLSLPVLGLSHVVELIKNIAGGEVLPEVADTIEKDRSPVTTSIRPERANKLLGLDLSSNKMTSLLESIEFKVDEKGDKLLVTVPQFRLDIEREEDVIEEVGRLFGYENIEPKMPVISLYPPTRNINNYWVKQIRKYLSSNGFHELYQYSFISEDVANDWRFDIDKLWELKNPISEDFKYMRPSLVPNVAKVAKENLKFFESVEVFETGRVFIKEGKNKKESLRLCMAIAGPQKKGDELFYELKGKMEDLFHSLGITDTWLDDALTDEERKELSYLHPARRAQIKSGDDLYGSVGQVDPRISSKEKLKGALIVLDVDLDKVIEDAEEEQIYTPISGYPQSVRDISILVPKNTKTDEVLNIINSAGGNLLRDVDMFDYYEGAGEEEKSMAFHLIFQADDRTLKSEEVDELMSKITHELEDHQGWGVR